MITGKDIRKELQGNYVMFIVAVLVFAAIAAFCAVFCGTQLGWSHLFTIISLALCGISFIVFAVIMIKMLMVRNNKLFKKYGSADTIAQSINKGLLAPLFHSHRLLITEKFIVNEGNYSGYMELKDISRIHAQYIPDVNTVYVGGNVVAAAAMTAVSNYATQKYRDSQGVTATNRFDNLTITDNEGKVHYFMMHHTDAQQVIDLFMQLLPNVQITY